MSVILSKADDYTKVSDNLQLAADITKKLEKHYPGYLWGVLFDEDGGVATITNETLQHPILSHHKYGYVLHLRRIHGDPDLRCVMRAGGEILERSRMHRSKPFDGIFPTHIDGVADKHQPIIGKDGNPLIF